MRQNKNLLKLSDNYRFSLKNINYFILLLIRNKLKFYEKNIFLDLSLMELRQVCYD